MSRVRFLENNQKNFLNEIKKESRLKWSDIAGICSVHKRTLFDWRRNKYQMSYKALKELKKKSNIPIPRRVEILPENWNIRNAARLGGIKRGELYGPLGTSEGRSKGGKATQKKFRANPKYIKKIGFKQRKAILLPQKSSLLAEFIGIMLGDGHIDRYQITVSMSNKVDRGYGRFVSKLIEKLFGIATVAKVRKNTLIIIAGSKNLIDYLIGCGLKEGDKINQQIDIPKWIFKHRRFIKACLRGLIDTDGGIYFHNHTTKGIKYRHIGLCFTSNSLPLLKSARKIFLTLGFDIKCNSKNRLFLYGKEEVRKYLKLVGTNNPKHLTRFKSYKASK
jgi:intein/homing endonuclease